MTRLVGRFAEDVGHLWRVRGDRCRVRFGLVQEASYLPSASAHSGLRRQRAKAGYPGELSFNLL